MIEKIYRGDDTNAFGQNFMKINPPNLPAGAIVTKAILQCGPIQKIYLNPQFPIYVNFSHEETKKFTNTNECFLQLFDENGLRQTCKGSITFYTYPQAVVDEPRNNRQQHNSRS